MTTTAFDDQFTVGTQTAEPVHQPYDIASILRRNVADLEIALKRQTDRSEAAEAELLAIREDNHSMMLEIDGLRTERDRLMAELNAAREQEPVAWDCGGSITANSGYAEWFFRKDHGAAVPLYTSHVPALTVPAMTVCHMECDECAKAGKCLYSTQAKHSLIPAPTPFIPDDDTRRNDAEFAAQQAATAPTDEQIHAAYRNALGQSIRERDMPEIRKFARALLQSAGGWK